MGWETRKQSGDEPPRGERSADEHIRDDVRNRLADDPGIDASGIEVRVDDARVVLSGSVRDELTRQMAEVVAFEAEGVRGVDNDLKIGFRPRGEAAEPPSRHDSQPPIEPGTGRYLGASVAPQGSSLDSPNDPDNRPGIGTGGMPADTSGSPLESGVNLGTGPRKERKRS